MDLSRREKRNLSEEVPIVPGVFSGPGPRVESPPQSMRWLQGQVTSSGGVALTSSLSVYESEKELTNHVLCSVFVGTKGPTEEELVSSDGAPETDATAMVLCGLKIPFSSFYGWQGSLMVVTPDQLPVREPELVVVRKQ